jgi:hypothetical protein
MLKCILKNMKPPIIKGNKPLFIPHTSKTSPTKNSAALAIRTNRQTYCLFALLFPPGPSGSDTIIQSFPCAPDRIYIHGRYHGILIPVMAVFCVRTIDWLA